MKWAEKKIIKKWCSKCGAILWTIKCDNDESKQCFTCFGDTEEYKIIQIREDHVK